MYEFRAVTERMKVMHERTRERVFHVCAERPLIITRAHQKYEHALPEIRNAQIFKAMCEEQTVRVEPWEMLVANHTRFFCGSRHDPRWGGADMYARAIERGDWTMGDFCKRTIASLREEIGSQGRVLLALSGGVDSSVLAALLAEAHA